MSPCALAQALQNKFCDFLKCLRPLEVSAQLRMSALGQKQTCAAHKGMSALPPKADNLQGTSPCPLSANRGHPSSHIYRRRLSMILGLRVFKRWLCDVGILPTRSHHVEPGALGDAARLHAGVARRRFKWFASQGGASGRRRFCWQMCVTVRHRAAASW